jgi:hypothetical protein
MFNKIGPRGSVSHSVCGTKCRFETSCSFDEFAKKFVSTDFIGAPKLSLHARFSALDFAVLFLLERIEISLV